MSSGTAFSTVTVGTGTTALVPANGARSYLYLQNDSDEAIYIMLGAAAVLNTGIRLNANGGSYEMSSEHQNLEGGALNAISTSGSKKVLVVERSA